MSYMDNRLFYLFIYLFWYSEIMCLYTKMTYMHIIKILYSPYYFGKPLRSFIILLFFKSLKPKNVSYLQCAY